MPPSRPAFAPGELLEGKYQIAHELGRGAMGVVYEALHMSLGRRVAVKTLIEGAGADVEMGARFEREARAASAIGHPHIIDVFDLGRTKDGMLFMVMELLDGSPLEAMLKRTPKLPISLAINLMGQVLSGLGAAHKHGIVHRDLKPDNIFVLDSEERPNFVKIVDFGISKVLGPKATAPVAAGKFAGTMVGAVLGTPLYMSPEQAIGQVTAIDHRTDIYSAGVVLYEMLCGRTPFQGKNYSEVLGQILEGKYPPPRELRPDIPPEVEAAIVRALSRDIDARFPSAAAMRAAISTGQSEITLAPVPLAPHASDAPPVGTAPAAQDGDPILLLDVAPRAQGAGRRAASPGADPFAPPPESQMSPLLVSDFDGPPRPGPAPRPLPEPEQFVPEPSPPPMPRARERRMAPPDQAAPARRPAFVPPTRERLATEPPAERAPRKRSWLLAACVLLVLAVGARFAYSTFGPGGKSPLLPRLGASQKVSLVIEPKEASVQIDHVPVTAGVLPLDSGAQRPHMLNAAAPGRVTRRLSFTVKPGMTLTVRLSHTLDAPSPTDPPPLPAELGADYPDNPRPAAEIDSAFVKLARYADCLALTGDMTAESGKSGARGRPREEETSLCQQLITGAAAIEPDFPELQTAAEAYLAGIQKGQKLEVLARMAAAFRAEFLAARAAWQMEELSRQGKDEGQNAAWHMRRVALAAQAWLRGRKAPPPASQGGEEQRAKLDEHFQSFMNYVRTTPRALAQTSGATDFVAIAEDLVALAGGQGGRKATEFSALDACRKLLTAFNALVVE